MSRTKLGWLGALICAVALGAPGLPVLARGKPTPSPSPTVAPVADPAITKLARQQFLAWQIGAIDKSLYNPELVVKMTDAKVADVSRHIAPVGALESTTYIGPFTGADLPAGARGYIYEMICSDGKLYEWLIVDAQGKIASIFFRDTLTTENVTAPAPTPT